MSKAKRKLFASDWQQASGPHIDNCIICRPERLFARAHQEGTPKRAMSEKIEADAIIFRELVKRGIDQDTADQVAQAALEALSQGWRSDIENAPRDGTNILAYFPLVGLHDSWCRVVPVYWSDDQGEWIFASRAASGFSKAYQPTRWMPLPTPPTEEQ